MIGIAPIWCSLFDILSCSIRDNKHLRLTHCMSVSFTSDTDKVSAGLTCKHRCQLNNKGLMLKLPTAKVLVTRRECTYVLLSVLCAKERVKQNKFFIHSLHTEGGA